MEKTQKQSSDSSLTKRLRPSYKMDDLNDKSQGFYFFWSFDKIVMSFLSLISWQMIQIDILNDCLYWWDDKSNDPLRYRFHTVILDTLQVIHHTCGCFFLYVEKQHHTLYYSDHDWQSLIFDEESFGLLFMYNDKTSIWLFFICLRQRHIIRIVWSLLMP